MRGEWPDWIEPIKAAVNVRFWEIARHRGTLDVATHCPVGQIVLHPHEVGLSRTAELDHGATNGGFGQVTRPEPSERRLCFQREISQSYATLCPSFSNQVALPELLSRANFHL